MAIDIAKLRHVIEQDTLEAAHDAGIERVAIRVIIDTIPGTSIPAIQVEVCELTPEQVDDLTGSGHKN